MGIVLSAQTLMAQVPSYVPTNGLVGYWPFSGNANDESGVGNNGTVNGATLTTDRNGNVNSAYNFDGINNNINLGNSNTYSLTNSNVLTFSVWINSERARVSPTAPYLKDCIFSKYQDLNVANSNYYFSVEGIDSAQPITTLTANGTNSISYSTELNSWINYVVIFQSGTNNVKIYKNGILTVTGTLNMNSFQSTSNLYLGFLPTSTTNITQSNFKGKIDDLIIWNRALTQEEISNLYNAQLSFNDPVTWANNITIFPNPASSQININFNNITNLNGGTLKIINSLGQEVATTPITTSGTNSTMQLATWGGTGMYFVQIINPQGQIVDIKKIILQ
jgi:hypothetical protein